MASRGMMPAAASILVEGSQLKAGVKGDLLSITVEEDLEAPGMFSLEFNSWDMKNQELTWVDDSLFDIGKKITVQMGYKNALTTLMVGEVTGLEPEFLENGEASVVVRGHDLRHRLLRGRKTQSFLDVTDNDIATTLIQKQAKLDLKVTKSTVKLPYVLQNNQTDLEFLQERANLIGYEIGVQDETIVFQPRQVSGSAIATLDRKSQQNLLEFSPRLSTLSQVDRVLVQGWDARTKKAVTGQAKVSNVKKVGNSGTTTGAKAAQVFGAAAAPQVNQPLLNQAQADTIALSQLNQMSLAYIAGEGRCRGDASLRAGTVIEIADVGTRFSGLYYVTATTHRFQDGDYWTEFSVRRNAT